jgi:hypothetical protein
MEREAYAQQKLISHSLEAGSPRSSIGRVGSFEAVKEN